MRLQEKYEKIRESLNDELKKTGNLHERQRLITEIKIYGAVIKDLDSELEPKEEVK